MIRLWLAAILVAVPLLSSAQTPASAPHQHGSPPVPAAGEGQPVPSADPVDLPPFIPQVSDADRIAAFPDVMGHAVHDQAVNYFVLFDQLEWQGRGNGGASWDTRGWVGTDRTRFWFRTEGASDDRRLESAHAHALLGRAIGRWWDVVAGVRQDLRPGAAQTWAAIGVQGLAPYRFDVEATAYIGASGRTQVRVDTEYELLVTNRLVLQPLLEFEMHGKSDRRRGFGAGLTTIETGARLRYEFRREVAPYVGVTWQRRFFGTADAARARGADVSGTRLVAGLRVWL